MSLLSERGQVAPLLALLAVGIGLAALGLGRFAATAVDEAAARTAADAAALAAAPTGSVGEARRLAVANGGTLESFESAGLDARARVRVGTASASARARATGAAGSLGPQGPSDGRRNGLAPALQAALDRAGRQLGQAIPITSGWRSSGEQARLWAARGVNRYPVAPPGTSMHERGLAVDVPLAIADRLASVGPAAGLCRPYPRTDPVHFEAC